MPVMVKLPLLLSADDILVAVYVLLPLNEAAKLAGLAQLSFQFQGAVGAYKKQGAKFGVRLPDDRRIPRLPVRRRAAPLASAASRLTVRLA